MAVWSGRWGVLAAALLAALSCLSGAVLAQTPDAAAPVVQNDGETKAAPSSDYGNGGAGFGPMPSEPADSSEEGAEQDPAQPPAQPADDAAEEEPQEPEAAEDGAVQPGTAPGQAGTVPPPPADAIYGDPHKVSLPRADQNAGSLLYDVAIDVVPFRGLEPRIKLHYNSSRKTKRGGLYQGWLGHGWGLEGFDVIERASPGRGLPYFNGGDVYLLNGTELVRCATTTNSPSCKSGGTHATEIESYRRIRFSRSANKWTVTGRDGTVSTFRTPAAIAGVKLSAGTPAFRVANQYRWHLTSVVDTNGNTVNYTYACPGLSTAPLTSVCYPNTVSYNGTTITFHREARPDHILMANGHDVSVTNQRIKTISVKVGKALRSAYTLTYDQAPFSNTSRLKLVERYGSNAAVAANGTVTPQKQGLPKQRIASFAYQNTAPAYALTDTKITPVPGTGGPFPLPSSSITGKKPLSVGDLDFDGRDELYGNTLVQKKGQSGSSSEWYQSLVRFGADGRAINTSHLKLWSASQHRDGNERPPKSFSVHGRFNPAKKTMDFLEGSIVSRGWSSNGDYERFGAYNYVLATGSTLALSRVNCDKASGIYAHLCHVTKQSSKLDNGRPYVARPLVADFDGDGIDTAYVAPKNSSVQRSSGPADVNGNGRQRVLMADGRKAELVSGSWRYSGDAINMECIGKPPSGSRHNRCVMADVNGDGAMDVIVGRDISAFNNAGADFVPAVYLSTGRSFKRLPMPTKIGGRLILRDYNNDGRADFLTVDGWGGNSVGWKPSGRLRAYSLRLGSAKALALVTTFSGTRTVVVGDFNGDGLPDFFDGTRTNRLHVSNPGTGNPDLLRSVVNELGATISVDYSPSSRWKNDFLPQIMHAVSKLSVNDGRGQVAETRYAYAGGKYDPKARKFLGFRTVRETKPRANGETASPVVETTFRQDVASHGLPALTVFKDAAGKERKRVAEAYAVNTARNPTGRATSRR